MLWLVLQKQCWFVPVDRQEKESIGKAWRASASPSESHCCCAKRWGVTLQVSVGQRLPFLWFFAYLPCCGQASVRSCPAAASSHQDFVRGSKREAQNCNSKINKIENKE